MYGEHCLRAWSVSQKVVALSSGEAEYYGMVRGASVATGLKGMLGDLGVDVELVLYTDASAAIGIAKRRGLGKIRHLELAELWLQDLVNRDRVRVEKVLGENNYSDSLTKYTNSIKIEQTMHCANQMYMHGRHALMPQVTGDSMS